jgi:hypothetical protein
MEIYVMGTEHAATAVIDHGDRMDRMTVAGLAEMEVVALEIARQARRELATRKKAAQIAARIGGTPDTYEMKRAAFEGRTTP